MEEALRGGIVKEQYAEWLQQYQWDYFFTSTFRLTLTKPHTAFKNVWNELQRHGVSRAFVVCEPFKVSGGLHAHGLIAGPGPGWRPGIELPWDIQAGFEKRYGIARFESARNDGAVSSYCAKYLLKEQSSAYDYYEVYGHARCWKEGLLEPVVSQ